MNRPTERMVIVAQGLLGENEEFPVYRWSLPSESTKALAPTEQALPSFFKPVATPSAPAVPVPTSTTRGAPTSAPSTAVPTPTLAPTAVPTGPAPTTNVPSTPLVCDQCGTGPFENLLKLQGHKMKEHAPKKRRKKPLPDFTPVPSSGTSAPAVATASAPTTPTASTVTPPTATAPVPFVASPDQGTLPTTPSTPPDSILGAAQIQAPTPALAGPVTAPVPTPEPVPAQVRATPELIEGVSEPAIKYARLCGLVKKGLTEFKLQFEASFPGHDIAKVLEASHCTIVDDRVVFTGGA